MVPDYFIQEIKRQLIDSWIRNTSQIKYKIRKIARYAANYTCVDMDELVALELVPRKVENFSYRFSTTDSKIIESMHKIIEAMHRRL